MEQEDDNPKLVDLLYDDELDEETASRVRADLDSSEKEELEEYEELLGEIREHEPEPEVPSSVHDSIMDAAREASSGGAQTDDGRERAVRPEQRSPAPKESSGLGIWERLSSNSAITQLSVAAMALLAGGTALYLMTGTVTEDKQTSAGAKMAEKSASSDKFAEPEPEKSPEAPAPSEGMEQKLAKEKSATQEITGEAASDRNEPSKAGESTDPPDRERQARRQPSPTKRRERQDSQESSSSGADELFAMDDSKGPEPTGDGAESEPSSKSAGLDRTDDKTTENADSVEMFGSAGPEKETSFDEERQAEKPKKQAQSAEPEADDSAAVGDLAMGGSAKRSDSEQKTEAAPAQKQKSPDDGPALADVETAFENGKWGETIRLADEVIAARQGVDQVEKPRVLELKARALENVGRLDSALRTYTALSENHPHYKSAFVQRARKRVRARRSARASKEKSEETASSESSSDEPAADRGEKSSKEGSIELDMGDSPAPSSAE